MEASLGELLLTRMTWRMSHQSLCHHCYHAPHRYHAIGEVGTSVWPLNHSLGQRQSSHTPLGVLHRLENIAVIFQQLLGCAVSLVENISHFLIYFTGGVFR